jgi:CBS domain-containing protein
VGLISLHQIKEGHGMTCPATTAAEIMLPFEQLKRTGPDTPLWTVLQQMDRDGVNQLPVTHDHHVFGMLSREGAITFLRTLQELG